MKNKLTESSLPNLSSLILLLHLHPFLLGGVWKLCEHRAEERNTQRQTTKILEATQHANDVLAFELVHFQNKFRMGIQLDEPIVLKLKVTLFGLSVCFMRSSRRH
jgi:hypothetical protein